jgi:hypothetical protein
MDLNGSLEPFVLQNSNRFAIQGSLDDGVEEPFATSWKEMKVTSPLEDSSKKNDPGTVCSFEKSSRAVSRELRDHSIEEADRTPEEQHARAPEQVGNEQLCRACQSIFYHSPKFDSYLRTETQELHSSYISFQGAVEAGCYVCSLINQKIETSFGIPKQSRLGAQGIQGLSSIFDSLKYQILHVGMTSFIFFRLHERDGITSYGLLKLILLAPGDGKVTPLPLVKVWSLCYLI